MDPKERSSKILAHCPWHILFIHLFIWINILVTNVSF